MPVTAPAVTAAPVPPVPAPPAPAQATSEFLAPQDRGYSFAGIGDYEVVYDDSRGYPMLAFADGHWFDVTSVNPRPVSVRHALRRDPAWAGAVVQTCCLWMRSNPNHERSFDLATELALAVGELARQHS